MATSNKSLTIRGLFIGTLVGVVIFWVMTLGRGFWPMHLVRAAFLAMIGGLLWLRARRQSVLTHPAQWHFVVPLLILAAAMFLYLISSAAADPKAYLVHWSPASRPDQHVWESGLFRCVAFALLMASFLAKRARSWAYILGMGFIVSQVVCFSSLIRTTGGAAIWRDDHPSFIFRIYEIARTVPQFYNYSPYWNAGAADFAPTQTGANAMALPFLPFLTHIDLFQAYTWLYAVMFIVLLPLGGVFAVRVVGGRWPAAWVGGLLCLAVSRDSILWALHFGTVGAAISSACFLPFSAAMFRVMQMGRHGRATAALLVISGIFLMLWPAAAAMLGPLILAVLCSWRRWTWTRWRFVAVCALLVGVVVAKPCLTLLFNAGNITRATMIHHAGAGFDLWPALAHGWDRISGTLRQSHPVLAFLGVGGLIFGGHRHMRRWFGLLAVSLAAIVFIVPEIAPDLQLHRMAVPMMYVLVVPAAFAFQRLIEVRAPVPVIVRSGLIGLVILGGLSVGRIYRNRQDPYATRYRSMGAEVTDLVSWVQKNVPENGRLMFSGSSVHAYNAGHIAPLALMTGREMMGCDYFHFPVGSVEYDYPPHPFRMPVDRVAHFIELHNITHVVTWRQNWINYYQASDYYRRVMVFSADTSHPKHMFEVKRKPNIFVKGSGSVSADFNRITISPNESDSELVIKYNWVEGLRTKAPAEVYPVDMGDDIRFIGIRPNGESNVVIRFHSRL